MRIKVALAVGWLLASSHAAAQPHVQAAPPAASVVDLDGDGRLDRVFNERARVVRQTASGPLEEDLRLAHAQDNPHVTGQFTLDGRPALVVMAPGHDDDFDPFGTHSDNWGSVGVFQFTAGAPARRVWEFRSEFDRRDDFRDWRFVPQHDGSVLATSQIGDDGVRRAAVSTRLVRNNEDVFAQSTCWQRPPLAEPQPPCETTLVAGGGMRSTELTRPGPNTSIMLPGMRVTVLLWGTTRHGAATLSCVQLRVRPDVMGWAYVTDADRARCRPVRR